MGESDSGQKLKTSLSDYVQYTLFGRDDSPLYLFESALEDHPEAKQIVNDYKVPKFFEKNLFAELVSNNSLSV